MAYANLLVFCWPVKKREEMIMGITYQGEESWSSIIHAEMRNTTSCRLIVSYSSCFSDVLVGAKEALIVIYYASLID